MMLLTGLQRDSVETVNQLEVVIGEIDVMSTGETDKLMSAKLSSGVMI